MNIRRRTPTPRWNRAWAGRLGWRVTVSAVAILLTMAAMVALPLVVLAQTPSAELTGLSLSSGTLRPTFAAATTEYRAAVKYSVSQVTVTAMAAAAALWSMDPSDFALADADAATGFQVHPGVGETTFKVKVTSGADTETYTVTVERDSANVFGWTPSRDINALEAAGNASPKGIWANATTMWIAEGSDIDEATGSSYAFAEGEKGFDLSGVARDPDQHPKANSMNGIVNSRRRPMNRLPRLVILILILAVVAVVTPATAPVNAQQTSGICDRTPEVEAVILAQVTGATCSTITDAQLSAIVRSLLIEGYSSPTLLSSDFAGLHGVNVLTISASPDLETVPANAFSEMPHLRDLYLTDNAIDTLHPNAFGDLSELEALELTYNHIKILEEGVFNGLSSLTRLILHKNALAEVNPGVFDALTSLTYLALQSNNIADLDAGTFNKLTGLTSLILSENELSSVHADLFDGLTSLPRLYAKSRKSNG